MKRQTRQHGYALIYLLGFMFFLGAAAASWQGSFAAYYPQAVRGPDRARARALAQAAWEQARLALSAGQSAARDDAGPAGRVVVESQALAAGLRLTITAWVQRPVGSEWLAHRLILDLDPNLAVRRRVEAGG